MKIKDIPIEFRPRERLKLKGKETLSDIELLSIILKPTKRPDYIQARHRLQESLQIPHEPKLPLSS